MNEWLNDQLWKGELRRVPELFEADTHPRMPPFGLRMVRATQTIPPGEIEAEVAVRLARDYRMMDLIPSVK